jgi:hypothetical protein
MDKETHANNQLTINQFNKQTGLTVQPVDSGIDDGRFILANILLSSNSDHPIATILNIYRPVGSDLIKVNFFKALLGPESIIRGINQDRSNMFIPRWPELQIETHES